MSNSSTRRKFLTGISLTTSLLVAGCTSNDGSGSDVKDSDGDGMIDSKDYAPNDPEVQEKSDVSGGSDDSDTTTDTSTETEEQEIGGNDPEITLSVTADISGDWQLDYAYEGAAGEESDTEFGSYGRDVSIPGDATYVEADLGVNSGSNTDNGQIGLELKSNSTTVDECSDSGTELYLECHVEGRTQ